MAALPPVVEPGTPPTALAPMQDVTTLPFMGLIAHYGAPDYFFTEYFRVHAHSRLEPHILASVTENTSGRPVFAQLIGENLDDLTRTVNELLAHPIAGIDLNMGCPAPKVYKKKVGGGLLRDVEKVDAVLERLRAVTPGLFTVKMRIGFDSDENFEAILDLLIKHRVDLLSLHARTVKEMYRGDVHYAYIRRAAERLPCPVYANGNITSAGKAATVLDTTGCAGLMIGRSAIRNPWIFRQIRERFSGKTVFTPTLGDVRDYIERLWQANENPNRDETSHVSRMKKFLNFVGQGVDPDGRFLHEMRRTRTRTDLLAVCDRWLVHDGRAAMPFADDPYPGVIARPTREGPAETEADKQSLQSCCL